MSITTYLSHSYRPEDQDTNRAIWRYLNAFGFSFFVDPPSVSHQTVHLEKRMLESSCFVAIVPYRPDSPIFKASPYMLYEIGLAVQARRPKLVFHEDRIGESTPLFKDLDPLESIRYYPEGLDEIEREIRYKLTELTHRALSADYVRRKPSRVIGVLESTNFQSDTPAWQGLRAAAAHHDLDLRTITTDFEHNALFLQEVDACDAVVFDARSGELADWMVTCLLLRPIPSVKTVHLAPGDRVNGLDLPQIVAGTKMDPTEPTPEHIVFWRCVEDLEEQLLDSFGRILERAPNLVHHAGQNSRRGPKKLIGKRKNGAATGSSAKDRAALSEDSGLAYFYSIGRPKARFFLSNSGAQNRVVEKIIPLFQRYNIEVFHYKKDIDTGDLWMDRLEHELSICSGVIALIDQSFWKSVYCAREIERAIARKNEETELFLLNPYNISGADVKQLERYNAADFDPENDDDYLGLVEKVHEWLLDRKEEHPVQRRSILPGSTREWVIDLIRRTEMDVLRHACKTWDIPAERMERVRALASEHAAGILSRRSVAMLLDRLQPLTSSAAAGYRQNRHPLLSFLGTVRDASSPSDRDDMTDLLKRLDQLPLDV